MSRKQKRLGLMLLIGLVYILVPPVTIIHTILVTLTFYVIWRAKDDENSAIYEWLIAKTAPVLELLLLAFLVVAFFNPIGLLVAIPAVFVLAFKVAKRSWK